MIKKIVALCCKQDHDDGPDKGVRPSLLTSDIQVIFRYEYNRGIIQAKLSDLDGMTPQCSVGCRRGPALPLRARAGPLRHQPCIGGHPIKVTQFSYRPAGHIRMHIIVILNR